VQTGRSKHNGGNGGECFIKNARRTRARSDADSNYCLISIADAGISLSAFAFIVPFSSCDDSSVAADFEEILNQPSVLTVAQGSPGETITSWQQLQ